MCLAYQGGTSTRIQIIDKQKGTFKITDWSDYPDDYVRMPDRDKIWTLISGDDYVKARNQAYNVNRNLRKNNSFYSQNKLEVHEIEPVKFGGSPTDMVNKVGIQSQVHRRYVTTWWNSIQEEAERMLSN